MGYHPDTSTCLASLGVNSASYITSAIVTNEIFADILVSIDDNKVYTKSSVDDCVGSINSAGYIIGTIIAAACSLEEASLIQIGDIGVP